MAAAAAAASTPLSTSDLCTWTSTSTYETYGNERRMEADIAARCCVVKPANLASHRGGEALGVDVLIVFSFFFACFCFSVRHPLRRGGPRSPFLFFHPSSLAGFIAFWSVYLKSFRAGRPWDEMKAADFRIKDKSSSFHSNELCSSRSDVLITKADKWKLGVGHPRH